MTEVSGEKPRGTFLLIQALRGVAALMVVWHHTTLMENERLTRVRGVWLPGAGGVDLFFVISGFVMVLSSQSLVGAAHPMRTFLARRVERVVPMYWLVTTLKLVLELMFPMLATQAVGGTWHVVASYLFLPSRNAAGAIHPVLIVGWTLNYEALFYLLVAVGLGLRLGLVRYLSVVLVGLAVGGWPLGERLPTVLSQIGPLLLEFFYGVALAGMMPLLRVRDRWGVWAWVGLMAAGFAVIEMTPREVVRADRPIVWGLAAMVVIGAAIALEDVAGRWVPQWLLGLGDASYANYLLHTLVLAVAGTILLRFPGLVGPGWLVQTGVCVLLCAIVAQAVHRSVELPMVRFFKARRRAPAL